MDITVLLDKLRHEKGLILADYREEAIARGIERRVKSDGAGSMEEYIKIIDRDRHLYWRLISDLFIGVTEFFRDKNAWRVMEEHVLPMLIERRKAAHFRLPLRFWSAGCSTGEETYSLAMAVDDFYGKNGIEDLPAAVLGTDIMEDKLDLAKAGVYDENKLEKIPWELRDKYFTFHDSVGPRAEAWRVRERYAVKNDIRFLTSFRRYDLVKDSNLCGFDMIVCRNVLIYFQKHLQEKVIKDFHKALRPGGVLWLGGAETLWGETKQMFTPVFRKERIFRKV